LTVEKKEKNSDDTCLTIVSLPMEQDTSDQLKNHFSKYGIVTFLHIIPKTKRAMIQFATNVDARKAIQSPEPVLNNRFIRVIWSSDKEKSLIERLKKEEEVARIPKTEEEIEKMKQEHQKMKEETKNELLLLIRQTIEIMGQKKLVWDKMNALISTSPAEDPKIEALNQKLYDLTKTLTREMKELRTTIAKNTYVLEINPKQNENNDEGNDEGLVQAVKQDLLKFETWKTDINTKRLEFRGSGRRGRGRGRGRGSSRGRGTPRGRGRRRGRGRGRGNFKSMSLDNRTTSIKISDLVKEEIDIEGLTEHFNKYGMVKDMTLSGDDVIVTFQSWNEAQMALTHGRNYKEKQLNMSWDSSPSKNDSSEEMENSQDYEENAEGTVIQEFFNQSDSSSSSV